MLTCPILGGRIVAIGRTRRAELVGVRCAGGADFPGPEPEGILAGAGSGRMGCGRPAVRVPPFCDCRGRHAIFRPPCPSPFWLRGRGASLWPGCCRRTVRHEFQGRLTSGCRAGRRAGPLRGRSPSVGDGQVHPERREIGADHHHKPHPKAAHAPAPRGIRRRARARPDGLGWRHGHGHGHGWWPGWTGRAGRRCPGHGWRDGQRRDGRGWWHGRDGQCRLSVDSSGEDQSPPRPDGLLGIWQARADESHALQTRAGRVFLQRSQTRLGARATGPWTTAAKSCAGRRLASFERSFLGEASTTRAAHRTSRTSRWTNWSLPTSWWRSRHNRWNETTRLERRRQPTESLLSLAGPHCPPACPTPATGRARSRH